jgi:uncharacterized protein YfbU (UPF0304 family)
MKLSDGEKLILIMLADMYKHLKIKGGEFDPDFIVSTIVRDHLWGFSLAHPGIPFEHEETPREVKETLDVLDMWRMLELDYKGLPTADKKKVQAATEPVKFIGFDANDEKEHHGIALYLVNQLKTHEHFKNRDLNSHIPSIDGYRRMLRVFKSLVDRYAGSLSADEIIQIMNARRAS